MSLLLALFAEALLILLVLTLGTSLTQREEKPTAAEIVRFRSVSNEQKQQAQTEQQESPRRPSFTQQQTLPEVRQDTPPPNLQVQPRENPAPMIQLSSREMAATDISTLPQRSPAPPTPNRGMMGPVDTGPRISDTPRVSGSGPNGEPLYAAAWLRGEPTDAEMSGYLSTATGPGWGLIACRTAPGFRVEDCVKLDEEPSGSNIARAALAAAWQFRVRPPRIGGEAQIGAWVRIRIDYGVRRAP